MDLSGEIVDFFKGEAAMNAPVLLSIMQAGRSSNQ